MASTAIEQLLGFHKSDRTVRAYAYLTASFNVRHDVNDVLDCLLPFFIAVINRDGGSNRLKFNPFLLGLSSSVQDPRLRDTADALAPVTP